MTIKIRHTERLRNLAGECSFKTKNKTIITIARQGNRRLAEYGATLLHELLHVWVRILVLNGFHISDQVEHKFIYAVEQAVIRLFRDTVRRK